MEIHQKKAGLDYHRLKTMVKRSIEQNLRMKNFEGKYRDTCHELKRGLVGRRSSNTRQLGCVYQDRKPPKSFLRKSSNMPKPIQRVKFTKAIARHTKIRDQNPSLSYICPGEPH